MFTIMTTQNRPRPRATAADTDLNPWLLWRPEMPSEGRMLSVAELAECCCPDICNRDHGNE